MNRNDSSRNRHLEKVPLRLSYLEVSNFVELDLLGNEM